MFAAIAAAGTAAGVLSLRPTAQPPAAPAPKLAGTQYEAAVVAGEFAQFFDPTPALPRDARGLMMTVPLAPAFMMTSDRREIAALHSAPAVPEARPNAPDPDDAAITVKTAQPVPLPTPRPSDLRGPKPAETARLANAVTRGPKVAATATPVDNRSFFEKLFGVQPTPSPALSYAKLDGNVRAVPNMPLDPSATARTAVYDITARVVYMPNGERLEAHSGLGDHLDDPRFVHVKMRGATPPGTYDLTEREQLFHGVRAIRLNPIGGSGAVHGRVGLLAHTYMLGPNGDSNGCVSFRDYDKFLHAYLRGEVKRLVVVEGNGLDALPAIARNRFGPSRQASLSARDS